MSVFKNFPKVISFLNATKTLLEWFGWLKFVIASMITAGWSIWATLQGVNGPVMVAATVCLFVAMLYLIQIPSFISATRTIKVLDKPNAEAWRHVHELKLVEAACLLADIKPEYQTNDDGALGWFRALTSALKNGEIKTLKPLPSNREEDQYLIHDAIARTEIQKFAAKRNIKLEFLLDD